MYRQLPGYGGSHGSVPSGEMALSAIARRIPSGFPNPSWIALKHHLFNARFPKKLLKAIRGNTLCDMKDEFDKERLFRRVDKIPISKTPDGLSEMGFVDY